MMEREILLNGLIVAHMVGVCISAFWFYPVYIGKRNRRCMDVMTYIAVICWGFIPLICLTIDLNKEN